MRIIQIHMNQYRVKQIHKIMQILVNLYEIMRIHVNQCNNINKNRYKSYEFYECLIERNCLSP